MGLPAGNRRLGSISRCRHSLGFVLLAVVGCAVILFYSTSKDAPLTSPSSFEAWEPSRNLESAEHPPVTGNFYSSDALPDTRPKAVIVESEMTANLIPVMLHFASILGPTWVVVLFTLEENWTLPVSSPFRQAVSEGRIEIRFLPPDTDLRDRGSVSRFLTQPWLWEQLEWAQHALFFQSGSIICSKHANALDDFLSYDFIGAPIDPRFGEGYNGAFSLRNPKLFLQITRESDFENSGVEFEDEWFYQEAKARVKQGVKLPTKGIAQSFSVETLYYERPVGFYQPSRWQADKMGEIELWCPEVKLLLSHGAT